MMGPFETIAKQLGVRVLPGDTEGKFFATHGWLLDDSEEGDREEVCKQALDAIQRRLGEEFGSVPVPLDVARKALFALGCPDTSKLIEARQALAEVI